MQKTWQVSKINCSACTFTIDSNSTRCIVCGTPVTNLWKYVGQIDGDTTYETPYTTTILDRASKIIQNGIDSISAHKMVFCLTRPPGHHSCENKRAGFCHKNFAIEALDYIHSLHKSALILDIDAHHGDGTEEEIKKRPYGTFISIHGFGKNIYPGTGNASSERILNIPLPPTTNSEEWLNAFTTSAIPKINQVAPDIIILSCGLDGHRQDNMMPLQLTSKTYETFGNILSKLNIPVLSILEGGYHIPVLGECVENIIKSFI